METKKIKNNFFLFTAKHLGVALLVFLIPSLSFADKSANGAGEIRSLSIWNQPVEYEYSVKQDSGVDYDGEAFVRNEDGMNVVILNKVFFKKEAQNLFKKFKKQDISNAALSDEELSLLEKKLTLAQIDSFFTSSRRNDLMSSIKKLQIALEYAAWHDLYQKSLQNNSSASKAENEFAEKFSQIRMKTIEYHEVSHLADIANARKRPRSNFERFTELNAFYTELAYGENPWDVMSQALVGFLDELNQQKTVDHSIEKVLTALQVLKSNRSNSSFNNISQLVQLTQTDYVLAGKTLHQRSYQGSTMLSKSSQK